MIYNRFIRFDEYSYEEKNKFHLIGTTILVKGIKIEGFGLFDISFTPSKLVVFQFKDNIKMLIICCDYFI